MNDMNTDISSVESSLVNGKRYSTTFLACVAAVGGLAVSDRCEA